MLHSFIKIPIVLTIQSFTIYQTEAVDFIFDEVSLIKISVIRYISSFAMSKVVLELPEVARADGSSFMAVAMSLTQIVIS